MSNTIPRLAPAVGSLLALFAACAAPGPPPPDLRELEFAAELEVDLDAMEERPSGLFVLDQAEGSGPEAQRGREVVLHYIGSYPDGRVFDSSVVRGDPITFRLGQREVIRAWDEGIEGMRVGGRRLLVVPPGLGYGSRGSAGGIPPNQVLVFELHLLDVR